MKIAPRKNVDMIDVLVSPENGSELRIDNPGDGCIGMSIPNCRDRRQGMDDVAERARFDDED